MRPAEPCRTAKSMSRGASRFHPFLPLARQAAFCYAAVTSGGSVDMRMSKQLHGWRTFIGEIGVVVFGVLIALFAQQLVQNFNDRSLAQEARKNIRAELAVNIGRMQSADGR